MRDLGYYSGDIDGMFGSKTREAVRNFQRGRNLPADGYANMALLEQLRGAPLSVADGSALTMGATAAIIRL